MNQFKPIIFGISGTNLTSQEKDFFINNPVVGFILFKRNIESNLQLLKLVSELKELYHNHSLLPLIFIDQEGSRVARLKPPLASLEYPPAEFFNKLYESNGKNLAINATRDNYLQLMADLRKYGINSPCAPVADLRYTYTDNIIGNRSFGSKVTEVVELCLAAIDGITELGGIPIIKHIPGHGRATCDSHLALPHVKTSLEELNISDFEVFRQLSKDKKTQWAMTAHIIFDALDNMLPVTISKKAINFIREDIGFKGTLISDDICMHALHVGIDFNIKSAFIDSLAKVSKQAFEAGCDIVCHCSGNIEEMRAVSEALPYKDILNLITNN